MKKAILILLIFPFLCSYASDNYKHFKDDINEKLDLLTSFNPFADERGLTVFDPDSLLDIIAEDITKYLREEGFKYFKVEDFPSLTHQKSNDNMFEVLVIGYHCGGTAGVIPHSIIIKRTNDKPLIYNIGAEAHFYQFHRLKNELYLCIGAAPGSSICRANVVYAIDFSEKTHSFQPVFNGKESFLLCNCEIIYEEKENMLIAEVESVPYMGKYENCKDYFEQEDYSYFLGQYHYDVEENEIYVDILKSVFDGNKFVKPEE